MIIYKEKQFLVFEFEDGKTVKYDFANKQYIGKRGKPVNNLCNQLKDLDIYDVINSCQDKNYADFIQFVYRNRYSYRAFNVGTILTEIPHFAKFEQFFSAGIGDLVESNIRYEIGDIPKGLIKLCKQYNVKLSNNLVKSYKNNPGMVQMAFNSDFEGFNSYEILKMLEHETYDNVNRRWVCAFDNLVENYGYNPKRLMEYLNYLIVFEGIDNGYYLIREVHDYATMMKRISPKFDKYPRYFLSTHKIACRNYNRLKEHFDLLDFQKCIDKSMEKTIGDFVFIYPDCPQDIKDEAVAQNNCVASYIRGVLNGQCHILFMRHKDAPETSLVTIEVRDDKIVQARQRYNNPVTSEQQEAINKWDEWREKYVNKWDGKGDDNACKVA